jgi:hypothetical protein
LAGFPHVLSTVAGKNFYTQEKIMSGFPCKCQAIGPEIVIQSLRDSFPNAPTCPACGSPVDSSGKTLQPLPAKTTHN